MNTKSTAKSRPRILRREDSLKSRQQGGICVRLIYECDAVEIVRTDMEPGTILHDPDITDLAVLHVVLDGSPILSVADETNALMPGDSVVLREGRQCRVSNPTSKRSSILSFLFRGAPTEKRGTHAT